MRRLQQPEDTNRKFKQVVRALALDNRALKEVLTKNLLLRLAGKL